MTGRYSLRLNRTRTAEVGKVKRCHMCSSIEAYDC